MNKTTICWDWPHSKYIKSEGQAKIHELKSDSFEILKTVGDSILLMGGR